MSQVANEELSYGVKSNQTSTTTSTDLIVGSDIRLLIVDLAADIDPAQWFKETHSWSLQQPEQLTKA